jgi:phytoene synthase
MMCVLMRVRDADALARACDLGLAMQLTNIARDVGEDARAGRLFLPLDWLAEQGIDPDRFVARPEATPQVRALTRRLLAAADGLYVRSEAGVPALPLVCRPGIYAARHVYAGIGGDVARGGYDSVSRRAHTSRNQKLGWLALSVLRSGISLVQPRAVALYAAPAPEVAFLVQAAARKSVKASRSDAVLEVFAQLEARDRAEQRLERVRA